MPDPTEVRDIKKFTYVNIREEKLLDELARIKGASDAQILREGLLKLAKEEGLEP
jgi:hypothetical protein